MASNFVLSKQVPNFSSTFVCVGLPGSFASSAIHCAHFDLSSVESAGAAPPECAPFTTMREVAIAYACR